MEVGVECSDLSSSGDYWFPFVEEHQRWSRRRFRKFLMGWFRSDVKNTFLKCLEWPIVVSGRVGMSFHSNVINHWGWKLFSHWYLISSSWTFAKDLVSWWILTSRWFKYLDEVLLAFTPFGREWTSLRSVLIWCWFLVDFMRVIGITCIFENWSGIFSHT